MDLVKRLEEYRDRERELQWEGTFAQYFEIATKKQEVTRLAHERIYHMIMDADIETARSGEPRYNFFSEEIFGIEKPLQQIVEYFHSAAQRLEVRKRILLLMGPVGGGKSTIVYLIKRGLEAYSRINEGALYSIRDCPMHEEPLHLIPNDLRPDVEKEFGLYIEGDLCPHCRYMVDTQFTGHIEDVPIKRLAFSEKYRVGVGTFTPSDPKSQDISELVGGIDLSTIGEVGVESDPRAYRFDGELNIANRGIMEFVEMLKTDEKFLYVLLTLSQEQNIKTGRFSMIYADEVVVSHTNEHEYQSFVGNKKSEALQDRIILVKVPYNLRASDEVKIYEKLLKQSALQNVHIAPYTLRVASIFAILTRLEASKKAGMSLMKKLKLYDGEDIEDFKQKDIKELQEEAIREGMDGISPRYIINRLSNALVKQNTTCINPIDALRALRDGLDQHTSITREERERYLNFIQEARKEYDEMAKKEARRGQTFEYTSHERLKEAIEKKLFADLRDVVKITTSTRTPDKEQLRKINDVVNRLMSEHGYCHVCANEILRYTGSLLNR